MAIHIFTRDLRIKDNTSLNAIETFHPVFIFTPEQVTNNKYKSDNAVQFMVDSLEDPNLALDSTILEKIFCLLVKDSSLSNDLIKISVSGCFFLN